MDQAGSKAEGGKGVAMSKVEGKKFEEKREDCGVWRVQ